jgi:hypothetical protein
MPKQSLVTFHNFTVTTADGKVDKKEYVNDKKLKEAQDEALKVGSTLDVTRSQTFIVTEADTWDEAAALVPLEAVRLEMFNYGLTLAQHNEKRNLMTDDTWEGYDGAYDLINDVQAEKTKRVADPTSAARKSIKAMWAKFNPGSPEPSDEEINLVLKQFMSAASQTSTETQTQEVTIA